MAKKKFKIGKINIQKTFTRAAVIAVTGAAAQIVETLVEGDPDTETGRNKNAELVDYGMIIAGAVLPEVVKGNEMVNDASSALLAIGAYRMAKAYDLSGKIGVNSIAGASDVHMIGNQVWKPRTEKVSGAGAPKTEKGKRSDAAMVL